jgi:glycyl-tRNA synthetase beta subunit
MTAQNLLVELFVEELPPKALNKLGAAFSGVLAEQLKTPPLPRRAAWRPTSATFSSRPKTRPCSKS